eukprot:PLAT1238.1.p1 GENE.PLAT1238.1~~PLAT1238.1.p1  ORF type:complete len:595 (+),score=125.84 PLAT1238.1:614-2398(+)
MKPNFRQMHSGRAAAPASELEELLAASLGGGTSAAPLAMAPPPAAAKPVAAARKQPTSSASSPRLTALSGLDGADDGGLHALQALAAHPLPSPAHGAPSTGREDAFFEDMSAELEAMARTAERPMPVRASRRRTTVPSAATPLPRAAPTSGSSSGSLSAASASRGSGEAVALRIIQGLVSKHYGMAASTPATSGDAGASQRPPARLSSSLPSSPRERRSATLSLTELAAAETTVPLRTAGMPAKSSEAESSGVTATSDLRDRALPLTHSSVLPASAWLGVEGRGDGLRVSMTHARHAARHRSGSGGSGRERGDEYRRMSDDVKARLLAEAIPPPPLAVDSEWDSDGTEQVEEAAAGRRASPRRTTRIPSPKVGVGRKRKPRASSLLPSTKSKAKKKTKTRRKARKKKKAGRDGGLFAAEDADGGLASPPSPVSRYRSMSKEDTHRSSRKSKKERARARAAAEEARLRDEAAQARLSDRLAAVEESRRKRKAVAKKREARRAAGDVLPPGHHWHSFLQGDGGHRSRRERQQASLREKAAARAEAERAKGSEQMALSMLLDHALKGSASVPTTMLQEEARRIERVLERPAFRSSFL